MKLLEFLIMIAFAIFISSPVSATEVPEGSTVTLSWSIPVTYENGNTLDMIDIGGYQINQTCSDTGSSSILIRDASTDEYVTDPFLEGNNCSYTIATFLTSGLYSALSDSVGAIGVPANSITRPETTTLQLMVPGSIQDITDKCRVDIHCTILGE